MTQFKKKKKEKKKKRKRKREKKNIWSFVLYLILL